MAIYLDEKSETTVWNRLFLAVGVALIGGFNSGLTTSYTATAIISLENNVTTFRQCFVNPTQSERDLITSVVFFGAMLGGLASGQMCNLIGRKWSVTVSSIPGVIGWMMIALACEPWVIIVGRILCGIMLGFLTGCLPLYLVEVAPLKIKGALGATYGLTMVFGILISAIIGDFLNWRTFAVIAFIPSALMPAVGLLIPESPIFLQNKYGDTELTKLTLKSIRSPSADLEKEMKVIITEASVEKRYIISWQQFKTISRPFFIVLLMMFYQQISAHSVLLANRVAIMRASNIEIDPYQCAIISSVIALIATLISVFTNDRFGRRLLLNISGFGCALSFIVIALCFDYSDYIGPVAGWMSTISFFVFSFLVAIGIGPIPSIIFTELTPYFARGFVSMIATFGHWFFAFLTLQLSSFIFNDYGLSAMFYVFGLGCTLTGIAAFIFLPETMGKTTTEIMNELNIHI